MDIVIPEMKQCLSLKVTVQLLRPAGTFIQELGKIITTKYSKEWRKARDHGVPSVSFPLLAHKEEAVLVGETAASSHSHLIIPSGNLH